MILDNKAFQRWIICAYTQILNGDVEVFLRTYAEYTHVSMRFRSYTQIIQRWTFKIIIRNICVRTQNTSMSLWDTCSYAQIIQRWMFKIIIRNICVRTQNTSMCLCTCASNPALEDKLLLGISAYVRRIHPCVYVLGHDAQKIQHWKTKIIMGNICACAQIISIENDQLIICFNQW